MGKEWWEYIRDGEQELSIYYLLGLNKAFPTNKNPVVKSFFGSVSLHSPSGAAVPPIQPVTIIVETDRPPEDFVKDWMDVFQGSGGLRLNPIKLSEKFAYSPASALHGTILQKIQYQRNQAKEFLATIQNLKTAIMNIESDIEKLKEQVDAFSSADWGQIKGIFADNYGGPDRSWTATARAVPLVRMGLTWFFRLNVPNPVPLKEFFSIKVKKGSDREKLEKVKKRVKEACEENKKAMQKKVDELVEEEKMNPALGNYIKRKLEEFWNWVANYSSWLKSTYERIQENLIQQKANLKMYMKWAADAIKNAESMTANIEDFEYGDLVGYFKKFTPAEAMSSQYIFAADESKRPEIYERTKPYVPVLLNHIIVFSKVEVQSRIADIIFVLFHGYMKEEDYKILKKLASNRGGKSLLEVMMKAGAITREEAEKIFSEEELKELNLVEEKKRKKSINTTLEDLTDYLEAFFRIFGLTLPKQSLPWIRSVRAASYAYTLALEGIKSYKASYGMLTFPL